MNYIAIIFISIITLVLVYTAVRLTNAIHGNFRTASELRNQYAQRIRLLPMFRMLGLRGIDLNQLLHQLPVAEIEKGIRSCESCDRNEDCQIVLKEKTHDNFCFCMNDEMFTRLEEAS